MRPIEKRNQKKQRIIRSVRVAPFRGGTPQNVFQTVHFGFDIENQILGKARKHAFRGDPTMRWPHRSYVVVEPAYGRFEFQKSKVNLEAAGTKVETLPPEQYIQRMIKYKQKTRHIHVQGDLPVEQLKYIINHAEQILIPNGKAYFENLDSKILQNTQSVARLLGFKTRMLPTVPNPMLEITFGLKKALPNMLERKNWPPKHKIVK